MSTELASLSWDLGLQEALHWVPVPVGAFLCDEGDALSRQGTPHPRCPLSWDGGSWRVAEVGAEGTVPSCPQSMGFLCPVLLLLDASWDPSSSGSPSGDSSWGCI